MVGRTVRQWAGFAAATLAVLGWGRLLADPPGSAPARREERKKPQVRPVKDWFAKWIQGTRFRQYARNAPQVLSAFDPLVQAASQATVRIYVDGKPKILGTVIDRKGHVITKASEVEGAGKLELSRGSPARIPARLLRSDPRHDLALLQAEGEDWVPIAWSRMDEPSVGSWLAAPSPQGTTLGIGIVGHAARWIRGGVLGIMMRQTEKGARIEGVHPKGGAAAAGLKRGDLLIAVEGKNVRTVEEAVQAVGSRLPGDTIRVKVKRGEEVIEVEARLGDVYESFGNKRAMFQNQLGSALSKRRAGFPEALTHDLALAPSECGGPLVDSQGRFVGINIARSGRVTTLAIPARALRPIIAALQGNASIAKRPAPPRAEPTHPVARKTADVPSM